MEHFSLKISTTWKWASSGKMYVHCLWITLLGVCRLECTSEWYIEILFLFKQVAEISVKGIDRRRQLLAIVTLPKGRLLLTVSEREKKEDEVTKPLWLDVYCLQQEQHRWTEKSDGFIIPHNYDCACASFYNKNNTWQGVINESTSLKSNHLNGRGLSVRV